MRHRDAEFDAESDSIMVLRVVISRNTNQQPNRTKKKTESKVICEGQLESRSLLRMIVQSTVYYDYIIKSSKGGLKLCSFQDDKLIRKCESRVLLSYLSFLFLWSSKLNVTASLGLNLVS